MIFGQVLAVDNPPTKVAGVAWAPNWGWLNFGDGTQVTFDGDRNMIGQAWSTNLGWMVFDPLLTGPTTTSFGVRAAKNSKVPSDPKYYLDGWFRACSVYTGGCPTHNELIGTPGEKAVAGTEMGGWDGWFNMKNVVYDPGTKKYSGFAWGDLVGGWVNFSPLGDATPPAEEYSCSTENTSYKTDDVVKWNALPATADHYDWYEQKVASGGTPGSYGFPLTKYDKTNNKDFSFTTYREAGDVYRYVVFYDSSNNVLGGAQCNSSVGEGGCTGGSCVPGPSTCTGGSCIPVVVKGPGCILNIDKTGADAVLDNLILNGGVPRAENDVNCDVDNTISTTPGVDVVWKDGSCNTNGSKLSDQTKVMVSSANSPRTICADFGGGKATIGLSGNTTSVDRPSSYPVFSRSTSNSGSIMTIGGDSANLTVDWGQLASAMSKIKLGVTCNPPQFCYKKTDGTGTEDCKVGPFSSIPIGNYYVRLKFPSKCPGTSGISVFHKPGGSWMVPLSLDSGSSAILYLRYNDPSISPI